MFLTINLISCRLLSNQDQANSFRDEMFLSSLEPFTQTSIDFLNQICQEEDPFIHLTYGSFVALSPNSTPDRLEQDFDNSIVISKAELRAQIAFDLCEYYLYDKKYDLAKQKVIECRDNLNILKKEYAEKQIECNKDDGGQFLFCTFTDDELHGRLMACGMLIDEDNRMLFNMYDSTLNKYKDMQKIFEEDNNEHNIPLLVRRIVELDMEGMHAKEADKMNKDSAIKVAALNVIRSLIDSGDLFAVNDYQMKYRKQNGCTILLEMIIKFLNESTRDEYKKCVKAHLYNILLTSDSNFCKPSDLELVANSNLFSQHELDELITLNKLHCASAPIENISFSPICTMSDWKLSDTKGIYSYYYTIVHSIRKIFYLASIIKDINREKCIFSDLIGIRIVETTTD